MTYSVDHGINLGIDMCLQKLSNYYEYEKAFIMRSKLQLLKEPLHTFRYLYRLKNDF